MLGLFVAILHFAVTVNAFVCSVRERFIIGIMGALVRATLLLVGAVVGVRLLFPGSAGPPPGPALAALVTAVVGPLVSFSVVWVAHRRARNVPFAEEDRLGRPLIAWLPVAIIDAALVMLGAMAWWLAMR